VDSSFKERLNFMKNLYIPVLTVSILTVPFAFGQVSDSPVLSDAIIEKAFEVADANKDGVITKKEFVIFLNNAKKARKPKVVEQKELSPE
jgi:hypothetical protein